MVRARRSAAPTVKGYAAWIHLGIVAVVLCLLSPPVHGQTTISTALDNLASDPHAASMERPFTFIVLGDSRTPYEHQEAVLEGEAEPLMPEMFHRIIAEANLLRPAFLIDVGDLILGYTEGDDDLTRREWDIFHEAIAASNVPFVPVVGNHDIWGDTPREIWLDRLGPPYFSFNYGSSHFIVLNSEELLDEPVVGPDQMAWLKADLEKHRDSQHIFVFIHKPFFLQGDYSNSNWPQVHQLLKQYPVRAVFAGHYHIYRKCEPTDGIEYVITGGGGAEIGDDPETGDFHHYLLVRVDGPTLGYSVIRPGSVEAPEIVTQESVDQVTQARQRLKITIDIPPDAAPDKPITAEINVSLQNPYPVPYQSSLVWEIPDGRCSATPQQIEYELPPNGEKSFTFRIEGDAQQLYADDGFRLTTRLPYGDGHQTVPVRKRVGDMLGSVSCPKTTRPPRLDGNLEEWEAIQPLPLLLVERGEPTFPLSDFAATLRFMWDADNLYMAAEVHDDVHHVVPEGVKPNGNDAVWFAHRAATVEMMILLEEDGRTHVYDVNWVRPFEPKPVPGVRAAAKRIGSKTVYEVAWAKQVHPVPTLEEGVQFSLTIFITDRDDEDGDPACPQTCLRQDILITLAPAG